MAGQANGTTGYEEGGPGAHWRGTHRGRLPRWGVSRSYSPETLRVRGRLVDHLVHCCVALSLHRLFTSCAEFRLLLRQDSAPRRLYPVAERLGLLSAEERRQVDLIGLRWRRRSSSSPSARSPTRKRQPLSSAGRAALPSVHGSASRISRRPPRVSTAALLQASGIQVDPGAAEWADIELKDPDTLTRQPGGGKDPASPRWTGPFFRKE